MPTAVNVLQLTNAEILRMEDDFDKLSSNEKVKKVLKGLDIVAWIVERDISFYYSDWKYKTVAELELIKKNMEQDLERKN